MNTATLLRRNFAYYWRTNLAVVFGVAVAVSVLAGALLVGDSVRASLRDIFLQRLGRADTVVSSAGFFREQLAADIQRQGQFAAAGFDAACPLVTLTGAVTHEESGRRGAGLQVYGVDERFWRFHGRDEAAARAPREREVFLSEALAAELGARAGDTLLLRIEKPSEIPVESLHGRKEDVGRTIRLTMREALPASALGEFSVQARQSAVRAAFVPLGLLQKELKQEGKINTVLVSAKDAGDGAAADPSHAAKLEGILRESFTLEDLGVRVRALDERRGAALESDSGLVNEHLAEAARAAAGKSVVRAAPIFSYLANTIRVGEREVPYSLVTAVDDAAFEKLRVGNSEIGGRGERETGGEGDGGRGRRGEEEKESASSNISLPRPLSPPLRLNSRPSS